jgi:hypothetical protein
MTDHLESDIGAAAFLLARGFKLLGLEQVGRYRYAFRFADEGQSAAQAVSEYLDGAPAEAKHLLDSLRTLKDRLYAEKGCNGNGYHAKRY